MAPHWRDCEGNTMALSEMDAFEALEALKKVKRDPEQVAAWSDMIHEFVRTQDLIARVNPPVDQIRQIAEHLRAINQSAEQYEADELHRLWRVSRSDKQRGQALLPKFTQAHKDDDGVFSVHLRFGAFYLGANRVVHGGAQALAFDEGLGYMIMASDQPYSRTAYIKTEFRAPTPVDVDLTMRGWIEKVDGRKIYVRGELVWEDTVCTTVEGLWVALKPGHR